jgi:hypothetical protein
VRPIVEGEVEPEELGATVEAIQRLKPIALEVVRPFLATALEAAITDAVRLLAGDAQADELAG